MKPKVAVIGTTFMDCKGFSKQQYDPLGRNLGHIRFYHGGVGRNVVENLAYLGLSAYFVSTVDNSALGQEVINRLLRTKVNTDYLTQVAEKGMGMWLAILDQKGDLAGSISQMPDLKLLEKHIFEQGPQIMETCSHVVLELDLNQNISYQVLKIAKDYGKPVYGIPGNLEVVLSNPELLLFTDCFICNEIEAAKLFGKEILGQDIAAIQGELKTFVSNAKMKAMVVTLGDRGAVYYDHQTGEIGYQPALPTRVVDSSGAGDAFFSGTVWGLTNNRPLSESVVYGTKVASWTIQVEENTCSVIPDMMRKDEQFKAMLKLLNKAAG